MRRIRRRLVGKQDARRFNQIDSEGFQKREDARAERKEREREREREREQQRLRSYVAPRTQARLFSFIKREEGDGRGTKGTWGLREMREPLFDVIVKESTQIDSIYDEVSKRLGIDNDSFVIIGAPIVEVNIMSQGQLLRAFKGTKYRAGEMLFDYSKIEGLGSNKVRTL